jgi:peptidoglycan biosynthesis protein MviN/MurJ (putative lipid II flippase)
LWSRGEKTEITVLFRRLARCTILVVAYLTLGIYLMGETATKILFERGAFGAQQTEQVGGLWTLLTLSLFPLAFGTFIAKFCQAVRGAGTILVSGVISFAVTWFVAWFGASEASLSIVASAATASFAATCCYWFLWLGGRIQTVPILQDIGMALFRMGLILVPAVAVERWSGLLTNGVPDALGLLIRGSSYSLIAFLLLIATRSHLWFLTKRPGEAAK